MNQWLQTAWELEEGTKTLVQSLAADNVRYAEVRFCPELHTLGSLRAAQQRFSTVLCSDALV